MTVTVAKKVVPDHVKEAVPAVAAAVALVVAIADAKAVAEIVVQPIAISSVPAGRNDFIRCRELNKSICDTL